ncbi:FIG138928: iron-regulated membrane protein [Pseudoalteromonas luteoviolacea B = ATCC 29581]|nr:FIG138928: iron-regulated membrane protein [Pseudoalteromonas luteoviolacea B = ATCC 29581]
MKGSFFRTMTWLHTWVGLLTIWLLILIFFAGMMSFFRSEINLWTQPGLHKALIAQQDAKTQNEQIDFAVQYLKKNAPSSTSWWILPSNDRQPLLEVAYQEQNEPGKRSSFVSQYFAIDEYFTPLTTIDSKGGDFFYRLHFDLHYLSPITARWLVCFASLFMLIALISGIIIHKRIFKDLFTWRSGKGLRTWLDSHNVSSVIALPFHLMITYTGLVTLIFMLFPSPALTKFNGDFGAFFKALDNTRMSIDVAHQHSDMLATKQWLEQVYTNWGEVPLKRIIIDHPGDANATIKVFASTGQRIQDSEPTILLNARTGEQLARSNESLSIPHTFYDSMTALHTGRLAKPMLRWLYCLGGLLGLAMLITGAILWVNRRLNIHEKAHFGCQLVKSLNLAAIMGLPLATVSFFWANRLLPTQMQGRAEQEIAVFFFVWLSTLLFASISQNILQWQRLAWLNVVAWAGLPVLSALITKNPTHLALLNGQTILWAFDFVFLLSALFFATVAVKLHSRSNRVTVSKIEIQTWK